MLFYCGSCDSPSCINGESRGELPSPYEDSCSPLNPMECGHVNTPPCPTRAGSRGPAQLCAGSSNSWRASIVGLFLSKSTSKESLKALPTYEERCSSSLDKKYARYRHCSKDSVVSL